MFVLTSFVCFEHVHHVGRFCPRVCVGLIWFLIDKCELLVLIYVLYVVVLLLRIMATFCAITMIFGRVVPREVKESGGDDLV